MSTLQRETDFAYLEVIGRGWSHLSTVLDGFSCDIAGRTPCTSKGANDVSPTPDIGKRQGHPVG